MGFERAIFSIIKAMAATEDYNLDMVLTDKRGIVIYERHVVLEDYRRLDVSMMIKDMKEIGDGDEK